MTDDTARAALIHELRFLSTEPFKSWWPGRAQRAMASAAALLAQSEAQPPTEPTVAEVELADTVRDLTNAILAREALPDDTQFVEGESEEFMQSPIGFSYDEKGRLVVTFEPSWEDIALRFAAAHRTQEGHDDEPS